MSFDFHILMNKLRKRTDYKFELVLAFFPARRACALRALGLFLADGALTGGEGEDFWRVDSFFYENGRNTGTERWEMNGLSEGYKRAVD